MIDRAIVSGERIVKAVPDSAGMTYFQTQLARYPRFDHDTETFLISPGCQAPRVVTGQWKLSPPTGGAALSPVQWAHGNPKHGNFHDVLDTALRNSITTGHNLPYDLACIAASYDDLLPLVFQALDDDRTICTQVASRMSDIALGKLTKDTSQYSLKASLGRFAPEAGIDLNKDDPWRLQYGTLWDVPARDFPAEAVQYLCLDAEAQCALTEGLIRFEAQIFPGVFEDLFRQTRKAFWHHLISCWGARTEAAAVERYHAQVQIDWARDRDRCTAAGLVRRDGTSDTKAAKAVAAEAWARRLAPFHEATPAIDALQRAAVAWRAGAKAAVALAALAPALTVQLPADCPKPVTTDGGDLSLSDDACTQLADPLLTAYQNYGSLDTLIGKIEKLWAGTKMAIQPRFTTPQATGRSSCTEGGKKGKPDPTPVAYGFQMQNPPAGCNPCGGSGEVGEGSQKRPCELCQGGKIGVRQCFVARSYTYLPAIGYRGPTVLCSVDYDGFELKAWAQCCLWAPGVGYSRLAEVLNGTIEINGKHVDRDPHTELAARLAGISIPEAYSLRAKKDAVADAWDLKYRQSAKPANFGFPGGMGAARFVDSARELYNVIVSLREAYALREAWRTTWTEAKDYFAWIEKIGDGNPVTAFAPPGHPAGLVRGGTTYTERSNFPFQNLASSAAGAAGWALARECYLPDGGPRGSRSALYGSRIWGFLHDEFVLEMPLDRAAEAGARQCTVQIEQARMWMPDLKITAQPALMYRWAKKAKTVYKDGTLVPWDKAA